MSGILDKLKEERKFSVWRFVGALIAVAIISSIIGLNAFFSGGDFGRDDQPTSDFLDSGTEIVVALSDNMCHIPGCIEIAANTGETEKMKYGRALGKGYSSCPLCINE